MQNLFVQAGKSPTFAHYYAGGRHRFYIKGGTMSHYYAGGRHTLTAFVMPPATPVNILSSHSLIIPPPVLNTGFRIFYLCHTLMLI